VNEIVTVAAITAFIDTATVERCFGMGMDEVLHKPVSQENLAKLIETYH